MSNTETLPLGTYRGGFRIARGGQVFAVARMHHGRPSGPQLMIGHVWRDGTAWRNDQVSDRFKRQDDAGASLYRITIRP